MSLIPRTPVSLVRSARHRSLRLLLAGGLVLTGCELAFSADDLDSTSTAGGEGGGHGVGGASTGATGGASGHGGEIDPKDGGGGASPAVNCQCLPEETQLAPCGRCGSQLRVCGDDCMWGLFGQCAHEGVCTAGETDDQPCGNCDSGKKTRACDSSCRWGDYGACAGDSGCTPGTVGDAPASCDPCDAIICQSNCQWGGCGLAPGKVCEWKDGKNYKCCGAGKWQFCSSTSCEFFTCAPCPDPSKCPC